jgi:2-polyprenyl-3-methyl-5-hydroxy-6-metoxy-1,4-benzoquinol methylase
MRLKCPECGAGLTFERPVCDNGHQHDIDNGILTLLSVEERTFFDERDKALQRFREGAGLRRDDYDFEGLPHSASDHHEWRARCGDLALVSDLLPNKPARVLDVGSSNGWLSNRLTALGCEVTAIDLFGDDCDGLGAMARYRHSWRGIRMEVEKPDLIDEQFDVVVMNHGLHFLRDPIALLTALKRRVGANGVLIALGLRFFRSTKVRAAAVAEQRRKTVELAGCDLLNLPSRGLFDMRDQDTMRSLGLIVRGDPCHRLANLRARVQPSRALHKHGIWRAPC